MNYRVLVTRRIPDIGMNLLLKDKRLRLDVYEKNRVIPQKELLKRIKGVDILLCLLTDRIDAKVMDAAGSSLKLIVNYAVGFNNIDVEAATKRKIAVANAPSPYVSESVAEHTIALLFALTRRIVESDAFTRAGNYKGWDPHLLLGTDVYGKTLGIIGTGAIGEAVVHRMHDGFFMKILYHDVKRNPVLEKETGAKFVSINELLKRSDFVSLHVPLLPSTHHLISTKELALMKKTAFLINTARGPVVDERELLKALARKQIAGAGLDVYECEPMIDCDPHDHLELRKMKNVVLTPHIASSTIEAREAMAKVVAENILLFLKGKRLPCQVNEIV
ncbi:TPA: D-glycerate dehydrogenase [Candidatus Uhrbacteria bacterium]|nr:D-glycerate dehydrogenase [Candidatus Uhrbacteria bacterium]HCB19117.1 D-glycerate dehydrogenase [Candidatus Uhrbacteria bacterium]